MLEKWNYLESQEQKEYTVTIIIINVILPKKKSRQITIRKNVVKLSEFSDDFIFYQEKPGELTKT